MGGTLWKSRKYHQSRRGWNLALTFISNENGGFRNYFWHEAMKEKTIKWFVQLFLSSLFSLLTLWCLPYLLSCSHQEGAIILGLCVPLAATAGVVLGDISSNMGKKLYGGAMFIAFAWAVAGECIGFFIIALFPRPVLWLSPIFFVPIIILSVISYNIATGRKRRSTREEEKQQ